ncbi:hypothetical protein C0992_006255, partial [Termitomyces sp. T32_za158]
MQEQPVTIKAVLAECLSISSHQSNMSSDSSLGVALVTSASTEIGRAIALQLAAKNFDIVINDLPEALKPLEALKAQIENEGRKSAIIAGNPSIESFWARIKPAINAHWTITYAPTKWAADMCSERGPGSKVIGVFRKIGTCGRYALTFVVVVEGGSVGRSVSGEMGPVKRAIRGLTEAAESVKNIKGPMDNLLGKTLDKLPVAEDMTNIASGPAVDEFTAGFVETVVADVVSFLTSKSGRYITGTVRSLTSLESLIDMCTLCTGQT